MDITYSASGYDTYADSRTISTNATSWASAALTTNSSGGGGSSSSAYTYTPTGWQTDHGPDVTMMWDEPGSSYEVEIYYYGSSGWNYYYTYSTSSTEKTFWPVIDNTYYAWSVRSYDGGWQDWSDLNYFYFSN